MRAFFSGTSGPEEGNLEARPVSSSVPHVCIQKVKRKRQVHVVIGGTFSGMSGRSGPDELAVGIHPGPKRTKVRHVIIARPTGRSPCPPLSCGIVGGLDVHYDIPFTPGIQATTTNGGGGNGNGAQITGTSTVDRGGEAPFFSKSFHLSLSTNNPLVEAAEG